MITQENIEQLKPFQARAIIEGLRKGLVPTEYVSFFTVGRQNWLKFVEEDLDNFIAKAEEKFGLSTEIMVMERHTLCLSSASWPCKKILLLLLSF